MASGCLEDPHRSRLGRGDRLECRTSGRVHVCLFTVHGEVEAGRFVLGVGGTVGALLTGVFAQKALNGTADGLLFGNAAQVGIQATAVVAAIVYSAVVSFALLKLIALFVPLRADAADEATGLDLTMHGEEAYVHAGGSAAIEPVAGAKPAAVGVLETA